MFSSTITPQIPILLTNSVKESESMKLYITFYNDSSNSETLGFNTFSLPRAFKWTPSGMYVDIYVGCKHGWILPPLYKSYTGISYLPQISFKAFTIPWIVLSLPSLCFI